jgi:hypothetical protein
MVQHYQGSESTMSGSHLEGGRSEYEMTDDPWKPTGFPRRPRTPRGAILLTKISELIVSVT